MYYCTNTACPAQVQHGVELFVSRGAMDIRGIGESLSATLLSEGLIHDAADLYSLKEKRDALLQLEKMGEKSVDNLLAAIEGSKDRTLVRLIYALGIRHVGGEMAQVLAEEFEDLDDLKNASPERLMEVEGVGPKIAESIIKFFAQPQNIEIIEKLRGAGVWPRKPITEAAEMPLTGMEFVITGHLEAFSREVAQERVKALGGTAKDNVTRNTTYLVVGEDPGGSKMTRARTLGTRQLTEEEFLALLEEKA
jgi:DNA ligase (NAD+)